MVSRLVLALGAFGPLLVLVWLGPSIEDWRAKRRAAVVRDELERIRHEALLQAERRRGAA